MQQEMISIRLFVSFKHEILLNICIDRRVKWKHIFKQCANLAQERGRWRILLMWQWTFGFHKRRGISWLVDNLLASYEGLCPLEYLISVLRYKFLILDAYHPDTLYLLHQRCEDLWLFFEEKRSPRAKLWETLIWHLIKWTNHYWLEKISKYNIIRNATTKWHFITHL